MKLSIIIICWNDARVIANCLKSIYEHPPIFEFEIIVSDNGSTDNSLEIVKAFPRVRRMANVVTLGFGPGNNAGAAIARGEYLFILNPDTIVHPSSITRLAEFLDMAPSAGAVGPRGLKQAMIRRVNRRGILRTK